MDREKLPRIKTHVELARASQDFSKVSVVGEDATQRQSDIALLQGLTKSI